jgi:hypothetical protein
MSATVWLVQPTALTVFLVCLSGWTRYHPPAKVKLSVEEERAALERELLLEPMRQQVRAQKASGLAALARSTLATARGDPRPPTGPGSPLSKASVRTPAAPDEERPEPVHLQPVRTDRQAAARADQAERRTMRISNILEWMREAQAKGRKLSVRTVQSRLQRIERLRKPISESTVLNLMRLAQERLVAEASRTVEIVPEEGQVAR